MTDTLIERLRATKTGRTDFDGVLAGAVHQRLVNPEGPEAADRLEAMQEALEKARQFVGGSPTGWEMGGIDACDLWEELNTLLERKP